MHIMVKKIFFKCVLVENSKQITRAKKQQQKVLIALQKTEKDLCIMNIKSSLLLNRERERER